MSSRSRRSRGRWAALLSCPLLLALGGLAAPTAHAALEPLPPSQPAAAASVSGSDHDHSGAADHDDAPGVAAHSHLTAGLVRASTGVCASMGLLQTKSSPTTCTHGGDPAPAGADISKRSAPLARVSHTPKLASARVPAVNAAAAVTTSVVCDGDGTTGNRVQVIYVHARGGTDRYAQYLESFRGWASGADDIYNASAQETGGTRHIRYVTTGSGTCTPDVINAAVDPGNIADLGRMENELRSQGFNRTDRKYLTYVEATTYCGIGGFAGDDRKIATNRSNYGPSYARVDSGCWKYADVAAHEMGHNFGAVSNSAPNTSRSAHCVDEWDVMCYSDEPFHPAMIIKCADRAHDLRLDCNHDDYYSTAPAAGSYLATHWNVADNVFLIKGGGGTTPPPPPNPTGRALVGGGSGRCLDVYGGATADGTDVIIWDCTGAANQSWTLSGGRLVDSNSGKCLDVSGVGTADGTRVNLWTCQSGNVAQQWVVKANGNIVNPNSGKCLDVRKNGTVNGSTTQIWGCAPGAKPNQTWAWR